MGIVSTLSLLLGGGTWSPVDLVSPEAIGLRVRLLFLSKGMDSSEVQKKLGLTERIADFVAGNVNQTVVRYSIGRTHKLYLHYKTEWRNKVPVQELVSAELDVNAIKWPPWKK